MIAVPYIVMIVTAPIFGIIIDKIGKMMFFTNMSCIFLVVAHFLLHNMIGIGNNKDPADTSECNRCTESIVALVLIGLNMTFFNINSNGSIVSALVVEKARGSAFGINYTIQNLILTLIPSLVATNYTNLHGGAGEQKMEFFFMIVSIGALTVNVIMWLYDMCFMYGMLQQKNPSEFRVELEKKRELFALERKLKMQKFDALGLFTDINKS